MVVRGVAILEGDGVEFSEKVTNFFKSRKVVLVMTLDEGGTIHSAVKGVLEVDPKEGKILLVDLYSGVTLRNLKNNPTVNITAIDEQRFEGYALQGTASITHQDKIHEDFIHKWQEHITKRISDRIVASVQSGRKSKKIFEAHLAMKPQYMIEVKADTVVDLSPR